MPTKIEVRGTRFYSQLKNGEDFSLGSPDTALKANTGGKYKAEIDVLLTAYHMASLADAYQLHKDTNYEYITKNSGESFKDVFSIGDTILFKYDHTTVDNESYTADVIDVTDNMLTLDALDSGEQTSFHTTVTANKEQPSGLIINTTTPTDLEFYYNLLPDSDSINYNSLIDGSEQGYRGVNITTNTALSTIGNSNAWVTGDVTASTNATITTEPIINRQFAGTDTYKNFVGLGELASNGFTISHEFIVAPLFLEGEIDNITYSNPPERLRQGNTLNYIFRVKASNDIADPNKGLEDEVTDIVANVGYVDENYNGGTSNYRGVVTSYEDADGNALDGIALTGTTTVTGTIQTLDGSSFTTGSRLSVIHQALLEESEYAGVTITGEHVSNVIYDDAFTTVDAVSTVNGTRSKIQVLDVNISSVNTQLLEFTFNVLNLEGNISEDDSYFLGMLYGDNNNANSDEVMINLAVSNYSKGFYGDDVSDLLHDGGKGIQFYEHDSDLTVGAESNPITNLWVEDKVLAEFKIDLAISAKIERFTPKLIVTNGLEEFVLNSTSYSLANYPVMSGGNQVIDFEDTRNFLLKDGSGFDKVTIENTVYTTSPYENKFKFRVPFGISYEEYRALNEADTDFFNTLEPNNGLNYDASNYSDIDNSSSWGVYFAVDFEVKESDQASQLTTYRFRSQELYIRDYNEAKDAVDPFTVDASLLTTSDVSTNLNILDTEDTKVRFDFTSDTGAINLPVTAVVRLEEYNNGGLESIYELSSLRDRLVQGNPLKPLTGDYASVTQPSVDKIRVECLIDKDLIEEGKQYEVKCRIFLEDDGLVSYSYDFEDDINFEFEDGINYEFEEGVASYPVA